MSRQRASGGAHGGYRRIVAKLGTNLLTAGSDALDAPVMAFLVDQIVRLFDEGREVLVVTSGAIAAGRQRLNAPGKRREIPFRQVLAAVGQAHLMQTYDGLFAAHGRVVGQTLLTRRDLSDRVGYLNARNTLLGMLEMGVVPIINENDAVAIDEIAGARIGDNDNLSALVANLIDADLLAILTDIAGLYTADPRTTKSATLIERVDRITKETEQIAGGAERGGRGTGGMITKLQAARLATGAGSDVFIADGRAPDVLYRLATGRHVGTMLPARRSRIESRKRWMLSGLATRGAIIVDAGAARALVERSKSLLPAGVRDLVGPFKRGDTVNISVADGPPIACGITNYDDRELAAISGLRSDRIAEVLGHQYGSEVVHRNNLVLL
jgi:glutamate 5-kinase